MAISKELDLLQRFIILLHRDFFDESPSPMKLQKLCYYVQGYLLAQNLPSFPENFQAWQHGPVVPELYAKYADYKWRAIDDELSVIEKGEISPEVETEVRDIVAAYGQYDGAALSNMTHRQAPWLDARGNIPESEGSRAVISKESIRAYFAGKLAEIE